MRLWHVPLVKDDMDGYYVIAETADEATVKVRARRDAEAETAWTERKWPLPTGMTQAQHRVWYFTGVDYHGDDTPDPDTQLAQPVEVPDGITHIPFLGYSW